MSRNRNLDHSMTHRLIFRSAGGPRSAFSSSYPPWRPCSVRFRQSEPENPDDKLENIRFRQSEPVNQDNNMEDITIQNKNLSSVEKDDMAESFGEAYATRSDEEGFGGIYSGNQSVGKCKGGGGAKGAQPADYERTQGSDVKDKEKAGHQKEMEPEK